MAVQKMTEIPSIDVELCTITIDAKEYGFTTGSKLEVEPQSEKTDAVKLVIKGRLIAQKKERTTITGNELKLTDNVFSPELAALLQGGKIYYSTEPGHEKEIVGYDPPLVGSGETGKVFEFNAYSAVYDTAGTITKYEKITYPNCTGSPISYSAEDGSFRAPEYVINSAPKSNEPPYKIRYVDKLPELTDVDKMNDYADTLPSSTSGGGSGTPGTGGAGGVTP